MRQAEHERCYAAEQWAFRFFVDIAPTVADGVLLRHKLSGERNTDVQAAAGETTECRFRLQTRSLHASI
jgi:hypothetical protein